MGGLDYPVIVEVKKHKGPVKKGDLLRFHGMLLDIPANRRESLSASMAIKRVLLKWRGQPVSQRSKSGRLVGKRLATLLR
jgi:hypothetical protein